jgi:hypothetical protein
LHQEVNPLDVKFMILPGLVLGGPLLHGGLSRSGRVSTGQRFTGLAKAPIAKSRPVYFDENRNANQFFMAGAGEREAVFDPDGSRMESAEGFAKFKHS